METSNEKKNRLLGMPYGTATSKLRKIIMFAMAKQLHVDNCYRCGNQIETLEEFSIEHIKSWQGAENPKEAFFDIANISFSHLHCNVAAGLKHKGIRESTPHGSTRYDKGCRCEECKNAPSDKARNWKRENNYRNINTSKEFHRRNS